MKEIRQGDVYWLDLGPSSGSAPAERHPCVIVQSDAFNRSRIATTVVCLITSNMDRATAPGNVALLESVLAGLANKSKWHAQLMNRIGPSHPEQRAIYSG